MVSPKQQQAFTLTELMVTVAVVGMLAALALPNIQRSRETAVQKQCTANLMEIYKAKQRWATDFKMLSSDTPPPEALWGPGTYISHEPKCGGGGRYTVGRVEDPPLCNREGHVLR